MVFQNPYSSLNPRKSVRKTLLKPFKVHGEMYSEDTLEDLLTRVELMPSSFYLDKFPHQLSGGTETTGFHCKVSGPWAETRHSGRAHIGPGRDDQNSNP